MEKAAVIADKLRPIFEAHQVALAYLFGSRARGAAGSMSDVDVAVVFEKDLSPKEDFDQRLGLAGDIAEKLETPTADVINLETAADPLIKYVAMFSGQLIFEKDKKKRMALERKVVRDYENTRELRRIARSVMREQLKDGSFGRPAKAI